MKFYSRGKLLISGEYLVLKGATALAVPLKLGQDLQVTGGGNPLELIWESKETSKTWFKAKFILPLFDIIETSEEQVAEHLADYLQTALKLSPDFLNKLQGSQVKTGMEFKRDWGFGSSSTLISNIAWWAGIDPFKLHNSVSSGSAYDVIAAREETPFYYQLDKKNYKTEKLVLSEEVTRQIFFVYLGKKKDSSESVANFLSKKKAYKKEIQLISDLSRHMGNSITIEDFGYYMNEHEQLLAYLLKQPGLKENVFKDLKGEAKSLGAWGGDFAMIAWSGYREDLRKYLSAKKLNVLFSYDQLVKT